MRTEEQIFEQGSTTYYWSSKFFSEKIRTDVLKLYSFVRIADNFVDAVPQDITSFKKLKRKVEAKKIPKVVDEISLAAANIKHLQQKYQFDEKWIEAFFDSMFADTKKTEYKTQKETLRYIYGSAEVIGLMMAKIMNLPNEAYEAAKYQGRVMQYINFIRDIDEDLDLGRSYFASSKLKKHGLPGLSAEIAYKYPAAYREFIEEQIALYNKWQLRANKGFKHIPRRERIALRTAVDMYNWTSKKIAADPFIVFSKKVKPSKVRVVTRALLRCIYA